MLLQELARELQDCSFVVTRLDEDVQDLALAIDGSSGKHASALD